MISYLNERNIAGGKIKYVRFERKILDYGTENVFQFKNLQEINVFLNKFENNQQKAYNAIIKELERDMANGKLLNNFTNGYKVNIKGYEITVCGVIKNGKPKIGTMFIPR